jgi:hypothetical protein
MKIDARDDAVAAVKQLMGLTDKEQVTLEMVCEHSAIGHSIDVEYVSGVLKAPLTLANVREYISRSIEREAMLISQAATLKDTVAMTDEDIVDHILIHCPHEVSEGMYRAKEAHPQLTLLQIVASVLIANRDALHAGDTVLLTPTEKLPISRGGIPRNTGFAPSTCGLASCGLPFIPKRTGAKYGCEACGRYAHRMQLWAKRRDDARRAEQTFIEPQPQLDQKEDGICACGQGAMAQAV